MAFEDFKKGKGKKEDHLCPYCRSLPDCSDEEYMERIKNLMEKGNANAFYALAGNYDEGINGVPQDWAKANELWLKAGDLGCAEAYSKLGHSFYNGRGEEVDKEKAIHYFELAAMNGNVSARYNLGCVEFNAGNNNRAYKHMMIAAKSGHTKALDEIKEGFTTGFFTKEEYKSTLRAYNESLIEMKSESRDKAAEVPQAQS